MYEVVVDHFVSYDKFDCVISIRLLSLSGL